MRTLIAKLVLLVMLVVLTLTGTNKQEVYLSSAETKREQKDTVTTVFNFKNAKPYYQVLYYTQLYAKKYSVPEKYLFRLLKLETGFTVGDTTYNPFSKRILNATCHGPYQIMLSTGRYVWSDTLKHLNRAQLKYKLKYDLEFNVHTGIKYIDMLRKQFKSWDKVFSVYNQGIRGATYINKYAKIIIKGS